MTSRVVVLWGLVMALLLVALACGPAATSTPTPRQPTPTPTATATPTPAPTPTPAAKFSGNFVLGEALMPPAVFLPSKQGTGNDQLYQFWSFFEPLLWAAHSDPPTLNTKTETYNLGIAESFQIAPDLSSITFKIRRGVMFHHGWGELNAHDVAWSYNNAMSPGSRNSRIQGIQQFAESWTAVDERTVVMKVAKAGLNPNWYITIGSTSLGSVLMVPKRLYDEKGEQAAITTPVGTGPFEATEWVADDHILARPVANHYRQTAGIASYKVVVMPEPNTRIAALKTGEIHIARVPLKFIKSTKDAIPGAWTQQLGPAINQGIIFGGNYWAKVGHDGADIYRKRPGFKADKDHPWIGDPDDPQSMERARKVRLALSMAIDRDAAVRDVQSGIGKPLYTVINSLPGDVTWKEDWKIPYDPDKAKQLLAEAGYPNCFAFKLFVAPGKEWEPEVGEAVAQFWRKIGCSVDVDRSDYAAARPLLVTRQRDNPWMIQIGTAGQPDAAYGDIYRPSPGFNLAIELPEEMIAISDKNKDLAKTTFEERVKNNQAFQDYITKWTLVALVSTLPTTAVVRPEITAWKPYMNSGPEFVAPETIVMK